MLRRPQHLRRRTREEKSTARFELAMCRLACKRGRIRHKNIQHTVQYTEMAPDRFMELWRD